VLATNDVVETNTHDFPEGIEIDILFVTDGRPGAVLQSFTGFGRSVHFADGTPYTISILNKRRQKVAVNISVDGRKANLSPILLRSDERHARVIKGFTLRRTTQSDADTFDICNEIEPFIVSKPAASSASIDSRVGTLCFEFFEVIYRNREAGGRPPRERCQSYVPPSNRRARPGVLRTSGDGSVINTCGTHRYSTSDRQPFADKNQRLEVPVCEITICETAQYGFVVPLDTQAGTATWEYDDHGWNVIGDASTQAGIEAAYHANRPQHRYTFGALKCVLLPFAAYQK
jgi:hypothetical protein